MQGAKSAALTGAAAVWLGASAALLAGEWPIGWIHVSAQSSGEPVDRVVQLDTTRMNFMAEAHMPFGLGAPAAGRRAD